jgi:hypothetical protein
MPDNPLKPPTSLLCKLGSLAVHVDEFLSTDSHQFDLTAIKQILVDDELTAWIDSMNKLALLPVKRKK